MINCKQQNCVNFVQLHIILCSLSMRDKLQMKFSHINKLVLKRSGDVYTKVAWGCGLVLECQCAVAHKRAHLQYACTYQDWTAKQWDSVFTDKLRFLSIRVRVWRKRTSFWRIASSLFERLMVPSWYEVKYQRIDTQTSSPYHLLE